MADPPTGVKLKDESVHCSGEGQVGVHSLHCHSLLFCLLKAFAWAERTQASVCQWLLLGQYQGKCAAAIGESSDTSRDSDAEDPYPQQDDTLVCPARDSDAPESNFKLLQCNTYGKHAVSAQLLVKLNLF